jgi:ligand-binding sensor domain-containing protein
VFLWVAGTLLLGGVSTVAIIFRHAQRTAKDAATEASLASVIPVTLTSLTPTLGPAGLVSVGTRGDFRSFVLYEGDLFVCNRSSLFRYSANGQLLQTWRVGLDLPPFPLVSLAVRQGIPQPELWIATEGAGALIWDGRTFRQLQPQALPLRKLTSLLALPDGKMLLGTLNAGLYATDSRRFTLFHSELKDVPVTALAQGVTSDEVWIGTRGQGVWLWRAGTLTRFVSELLDPQVLSICSGDSGVWVGTAGGVSEFADGRFRRHLAEGVFANVLAEKSGTLWISTVDEGTLSVDLKPHPIKTFGGMRDRQQNLLHSVALLPVSEGVLALGDSTVRRLPEGDALLGPSTVGLTNGHITALNMDTQKRLWIGYFDRGLDLLSEDDRSLVKHYEDDVLFCVNRIKQEPSSKRIFVATANGIVLFDSNSQPRQTLKASNGLISSHVTDLLFTEDQSGRGSTAIATASGVTFLNASGVSSVYAFQGLVNNHVYTLAQFGPTLMAGTLGGASLLKNGVVQASFTTANSDLRQNWITSSIVAEDAIYLGTYGSGVIRMTSSFEIQSFREFTGTRIEINPNAMLLTKRGIYAGTAGQGLAFLPTGQGRWHFWKSGLPSANVTALAEDSGNLYIGTDNGLVRVPEQDLII